MHLYPNLKAELARHNLRDEDIARHLQVRNATISDKMKGKSDFKLTEAMSIKKEFFPDLTIDYLFYKSKLKERWKWV